MTMKLPTLAFRPNVNNGRVEWKGEVYFTQHHRGVQFNTDIIILCPEGGGSL